MRIIISSNKDIMELRDEINKAVEDFVNTYRKLVNMDLVVTVMEEK